MDGQKPKRVSLRAWLKRPVFKVSLAVFLFGCIAVSGIALYYYQYYSRIIERRLSGQVFENTAKLYAAPYQIYTGQELTLEALVGRLQRAGLEPVGAEHGSEGYYEVANNLLTITPKVGETLRLEVQKGVLTKIVRGKAGEVDEALLPAELVTAFSDKDRQKRRIVEFKELPKPLVNALIAAEDNRFYSHWGFDPVRLVGAVVQSGGSPDRVRGTSTITQQLARNFFIARGADGFERSPTRKVHEIFISLILERRLTKQQILTLYANDVYLGARGSFMIKGFGEAAAAYFGKDLTAITLPEAALLAAIIPAPSGAASPVNHPEEAKKRRNTVLNSMAELGFITRDEAAAAKETEVKLAQLKMDASDAPYLVDYIRQRLLDDFSEDVLNSNNLRVYTTLVPDLQRAAVEAVNKGLAEVKGIIAARNKGRKNTDKLPDPQASLIVLDTRTGRIVAMVGGGDYGVSQYNRITQASRQPGSIFKVFVAAAALEASQLPREPESAEEQAGSDSAAVEGEATAAPALTGPITFITMVDDVETTFLYDGDKIYEPNNYKAKYNGPVTVSYAMEHSLNVPTIKIGEAIGFDRIADLAKRAGMNAKIKGYPSVALGAFEVTPIEIAGAYTIFPNEGKLLTPHALLRVVDSNGAVAKAYKYTEKEVISPQIAYMMTNLMERVIRQGTGARVRGMGFTLPAAGKTGTSRDGWFAGFTKDFTAIAWVGYDDNRDLNIEGAKSALPIWAHFMLKAAELYPPRDPESMSFQPPEGIEYVSIDRMTNLPATANCPDTYTEVFLPGTVPATYCPLHNPTISESIGNGVVETGKGIGKILSGIGGFLGIGGSNRQSETREEPSTSPR
jgi:penicillin-binding protein 1B